MKKSLIALAALAATGAFAQSSVTLYGRANVDISSYSASGATTPADSLVSRTRVADSGSRFGFRVNEDLGGGLRAFVTCETGINIDNGGANGQAGTANTSTNFFCSREGHVGVGNAMAELRLGRQNIWWSHGELNQTGANFTSFDAIGGMYAPSSGMSLATVSRTNNVILLHAGSAMGSFAGSQAYYVVDPQESVTTSTAAPNKGSAMGFKLSFSQGPIVAMVDYAKLTNSANSSAAATNFDSTSTKAGVGYKYAAGSIASFTWWKHERDYTLAASRTAAVQALNLVAAGSREQTGWAINLQHALSSQVALYAQYGKVGEAKNSAGASVVGSDAKGIMVGARYNLSKRTAVYGAYAKLTNGTTNALNFSGGAYASGTAPAGSDPKVMGVGIMHNF